jgi:hypothetical protein
MGPEDVPLAHRMTQEYLDQLITQSPKMISTAYQPGKPANLVRNFARLPESVRQPYNYPVFQDRDPVDGANDAANTLKTLEVWGLQGLIDGVHLTADGNPFGGRTKLTLKANLDGLTKAFQALKDSSGELRRSLEELEASVEDQIPEIEDSVSSEFIRGVKTLAKALATGTTLDMLIHPDMD